MAVAPVISIMTDIPDVQSGQSDGQALLWSSANSRWEPGAAGVSDHGALSGLGDDDHSAVYLNLAGGTLTGALLHPSGTSAAPSIAFSASPTMGFYLSGAQLMVSCLGVQPTKFTASAVTLGVTTTLSEGANLTLSGGELTIIEDAAANTPLTITGAASQSGDYIDIDDSEGGAVLNVKEDGSLWLAGQIVIISAGKTIHWGNPGPHIMEETGGLQVRTAGGANIARFGTTAGWSVFSTHIQMSGNAIVGDSASGGDLTLQSTSHATKGSLLLDATNDIVVDQVNGRLGVGTAAPGNALEIKADFANNAGIKMLDESGGYILIAQGTGIANKFAPMIFGAPIGDNPAFRLRGIQTATASPSYECVGLQAANSTNDGAIAASDTAVEIWNWGTSLLKMQGSGQLLITGFDAATTGLVVKMAATPSANPVEVQDSTGAVKLGVGVEGILDYRGTMADSTQDPTTDAPADWVQIAIGGSTYYIPVYAA